MDKGEGANLGEANQLFGGLVIQALRLLGVEHYVVSPGSRSTPLSLGVAALGKESSTVCIDERSAAFHALGRIKATRQPVALICTSGTAGAHYLPAVIEARESSLPLLILTADRPPELHHCHAGQTVEQHSLYGHYPVFQGELPLPEMSHILMRQVRELCRRAVENMMGWPMGPVHLNCPFREPFFTESGESCASTEIEKVLEGLVPVEPAISLSGGEICLPSRTLILAGPRPWKDPEGEISEILSLSAKQGWPILADGVSPLRYGKKGEASLVTRYDQIVRDDAAWESLKPDGVLLWGEPPTSKILRERLSSLDVPGIQIGTGKMGMNPFHGKIQWMGGSVNGLTFPDVSKDSAYSDQWGAAEENANARLDTAFQSLHPLFEGDVHRFLCKVLQKGSQVFYTSSLAVRDVEWFAPSRTESLSPFSQRGANGIDWTVSLARGIARGSGKPVYLVSGDLAFLHDSNGLLGSRGQEPGVFVVLINNSGGGIFELLPVARKTEHFESVFATPQDVDFGKLVEAHGGRHSLCATLDDLEFEMSEWDGKGICVAEVPIDRKVSADLHRQFLKGMD